MSVVEVTAVDPGLFARVEVDADAIEHAMHEERLVDLGLRTDVEVCEQIAVSLAQAVAMAGEGPRAMAALAAADYCDDPGAFAPRRRAALWRSCQLHGCEDLYWRMAGFDLPPVPQALMGRFADALLGESAGPGRDGEPR